MCGGDPCDPGDGGDEGEEVEEDEGEVVVEGGVEDGVHDCAFEGAEGRDVHVDRVGQQLVEVDLNGGERFGEEF